MSSRSCCICGTYRMSREAGKQGIPRTAAKVLKALLNLALQYGEVRPSLEGLKRLACVCKQTVVNCLKLLSLYGFVIVHRRIKRIWTPLGFKVVQDTNAYTIQEPQGLGAIALRMFRQASESRKWSPSSTILIQLREPGKIQSQGRCQTGFTRLSTRHGRTDKVPRPPLSRFSARIFALFGEGSAEAGLFPDTASVPHGAPPSTPLAYRLRAASGGGLRPGFDRAALCGLEIVSGRRASPLPRPSGGFDLPAARRTKGWAKKDGEICVLMIKRLTDSC